MKTSFVLVLLLISGSAFAHGDGGSHAPRFRCVATDGQVKVWGKSYYGSSYFARINAVKSCNGATGNVCKVEYCLRSRF